MERADRDPNVFLLTVDSLQQGRFADVLSRLADETDGVEFTNAVSTAPQTASAMPGLAAGVYHDATPVRGLPETGSPKPVAEILAENGYTCGLWTDNFLFGAEYNYDRGFSAGNLGRPSWKKQVANVVRDGRLSPLFAFFEWGYFNVYQRLAETAAGTSEFYEPAERLHREALRWLDSTNAAGRLCWIHYMDTHHPYQPPAEYLRDRSFNTPRSRPELARFTRDVIKSNGENASPGDIEDVTAAYEACCEYVGDELRRFVARLRERGHFDPDRDVLVVTADHGECLTPEPYGVMGHLPAAFWEEIVRVPLLVSRPDWSRQRVDEQVSLIDVMPTVLDALGVAIPESAVGTPASSPDDMAREYVYGLSIPYRPDGRTVTYRAVRGASGWKLFGADRHDRDETVLTRYERDRSVDERIIHATTDDDRPADASHGRHWRRLADELGHLGPPVGVGDPRETSPERLEGHLRDLGYI